MARTVPLVGLAVATHVNGLAGWTDVPPSPTETPTYPVRRVTDSITTVIAAPLGETRLGGLLLIGIPEARAETAVGERLTLEGRLVEDVAVALPTPQNAGEASVH